MVAVERRVARARGGLAVERRRSGGGAGRGFEISGFELHRRRRRRPGEVERDEGEEGELRTQGAGAVGRRTPRAHARDRGRPDAAPRACRHLSHAADARAGAKAPPPPRQRRARAVRAPPPLPIRPHRHDNLDRAHAGPRLRATGARRAAGAAQHRGRSVGRSPAAGLDRGARRGPRPQGECRVDGGGGEVGGGPRTPEVGVREGERRGARSRPRRRLSPRSRRARRNAAWSTVDT